MSGLGEVFEVVRKLPVQTAESDEVQPGPSEAAFLTSLAWVCAHYSQL